MEKVTLHRALFLVSMLSFGIIGRAQLFIPFGNEVYQVVDRITIKSGKVLPTNFHGSQKPYTYEEVLKFFNANSSSFSRVELKDVNAFLNQAFFYNTKGRSEKAFARYFYLQNAALFSVKQNDFKLSVNPVLLFAGAPEFGSNKGNSYNQTLYVNTRGAEVQGIIDNKYSFYAFVTDNQLRVPLHTTAYGAETYALPGESYFKKFKGNGVDFFHAEAYVAAPLSKNISWQFGNSRQFVGDGVRSLILSDFAKPHLFLKLNTNIWKLNYQNIFYELTDSAYSTGSAIYKRKYGATHILSVNVTNRFQIGFFETVIFKRDQNRYELNYLNPVIFYRAAEHSLGSPDNVILGLNYNYILKPLLRIYGQFVFDEFVLKDMRNQLFKPRNDSLWGWWGNKYAAQIGIKVVDLLRIKNLDLQLEYNHVRPYTFAHSNTSLNYTDFNQSMAHPLGANFKELLFVANYKPIPDFALQLRSFWALTGTDSGLVSYGADLLKSTRDKPKIYGVSTAQGIKTTLGFLELSASYRLAQQLYADISLTTRNKKTGVSNSSFQNNFLLVGLRLNCAKRDFMY